MKNIKKCILLVISLLVVFALTILCIKLFVGNNENDIDDETQISASLDTLSEERENISSEDVSEELDITENNSDDADEEQNKNAIIHTPEGEIVDEELSVDEVFSAEDVIIPETVKIPEPPAYIPISGITLTVYEISLEVGESQMPIVTMYPANATDKREIWESSDSAVAKVDIYGNITALSKGQCTVKVTSYDNHNVSALVNVIVRENAECTYIDGILVVNKTYPLPKNYAPGWDPEASAKLNEMISVAKSEGYNLWVLCGYRSYVDQYIIYNGYVSRDGQQAADRYSARPGHSEHQSGLAFDLNSLSQDFGNTPEGIWLAENCYKYGFIIRYPKEKESITGYMYEPWHVRYLGVEKAKQVFESGLCLEEFLGITSSYS